MKKDNKRLILWPLASAYGVTLFGAWTQILTMAQFLTLILAELTLMLAVLKEKDDDEDDDERDDK